MKKNLFVLGSCRLIVPIKRLHKMGQLNMINVNQSWYAHNSKEIIQRLNFHSGKFNPNEPINRLIFDRDSCNQAPEKLIPIEGFDELIGFFEISTRVVKGYNGLILHGTSINKNAFTDFDKTIISFSELSKDILKIKSYFYKIVIVCNIEYDKDLINFNKNRKALNNFLIEFCNNQENIYLFNINGFNYIVDNLSDNNHFKSDFIPKLSQYYYNFIEENCNSL